MIVSAILFRQGAPRRALLRAFATADVVSSPATLAEIREVMAREKFNRYAPYDLRKLYLEIILDQMKDAEPVVCDSGCRDPKDEKFLDLAGGAGASLVLSGDSHLLEMHPFRGISIVTPKAYLETQR